MSRLDYCNDLLHGTSKSNIERLKIAQNTLARTVCQATWASSATDLRKSLHWLPVKQRIDYKLAVVTYKAKSTGAPSYLASLSINQFSCIQDDKYASIDIYICIHICSTENYNSKIKQADGLVVVLV
jgi:hypothetical protein